MRSSWYSLLTRHVSSPRTPRSGRARSHSSPSEPSASQSSPLQNHRPSALRQSSIGIKRMQGLQQLAMTPNASTNALSQSTARLPALDEECQLETVPTSASNHSEPLPQKPTSPGRLRKVSSTLQNKLSFWKDKDPDTDVNLQKPPPPPPPQQPPAAPYDPGLNYTSNMVDVLDTLGTPFEIASAPKPYADKHGRSRGANLDVPHQYPEFSFRTQSWSLRKPSSNVQYSTSPQ